MKKKQETHGPANDRPAAVTEEWVAAAYIGNRRDMRRVRYDGEIHPINFLTLELDRLRRGLPEPLDAWDWDISRPIAEQLAETAAMDAQVRNRLVAELDEVDWGRCGLPPIIGARNPAAAAPTPVPPDDSLGNLAALTAFAAADRDDAAADEDEETLAWRSGRSAPLTPTDPDVVCACTGDELLLERCAS